MPLPLGSAIQPLRLAIERWASSGKFQKLLDGYVSQPEETLSDVVSKSHTDLGRLLRVVLTMERCLDPQGLAEHAAFMRPIQDVKVYILSQQRIPRAIEDHLSSQAAAIIRGKL